MSNVGISLIDLPWMQVRPVLSFEAHRGSVLIMTVILAEATGGTGDLGVVDTTGHAGGYPTHTAELLNDAAGAAGPEPFVAEGPPRHHPVVPNALLRQHAPHVIAQGAPPQYTALQEFDRSVGVHRVFLALTRSRLARRLAVDVGTITALKAGQRWPSATDATKIEAGLKLPAKRCRSGFHPIPKLWRNDERYCCERS